MARCESCDNIYTYCGLCGHTPTRVGLGSTIWVVRMWWHNMVSSRHTNSGPCGHTGVSLYTQFSPCGHRIFMSIYSSCVPCQGHVAKQFHVPVAALVVIQDAHANINAHCSPFGHLRVSWKYLYLLWPAWPHSQDSGPHGLGHMGRPNAMV